MSTEVDNLSRCCLSSLTDRPVYSPRAAHVQYQCDKNNSEEALCNSTSCSARARTQSYWVILTGGTNPKEFPSFFLEETHIVAFHGHQSSFIYWRFWFSSYHRKGFRVLCTLCEGMHFGISQKMFTITAFVTNTDLILKINVFMFAGQCTSAEFWNSDTDMCVPCASCKQYPKTPSCNTCKSSPFLRSI